MAFYLIFFFLNIGIILNKTINSGYFLFNSKVLIQLYFHKVKGKVDVILSLENDYTYFSFPLNYSKKLLNSVQMEVEGEIYKINEYENSFLIKPLNSHDYVSIDKMHFYLIPSQNKLKSTLSLSFKVINESHSIVSMLYKSKKISKRQFTICPFLSRFFDGIIYFGDLPEKLFEDYNKTSFSVLGKGNYWDFKIRYFIIENTTESLYYQCKTPAHFSIEYPYIQIPKEAFDLMVIHDIGDYIRNGQCIKDQEGSIQCSTVVLNEIIFFNFVFENTVLTLSFKELCIKQAWNFCILSFRINNENNEWIFGEGFMRYYPITFNYDNKEMYLYIKTKQNKKIEDFEFLYRNIFESKICLIVNNVITILSSILLLLLNKVKYNKKIIFKEICF